MRQIGCHGGGDFSGNCLDQHYRAFGAAHQRRFGVGNFGDAACAGEVGDHEREGFAVALLQRAQAIDRGVIAGVACQMEAAQAFQCDDFTGAKARHDFLDAQGELRATGWASGWLSVETAVAWVVVFVCAVGAEGETCHGGLRPVIGQSAGDGVARAAMGAVEKGIAPTAVLGIEQLGEAGFADTGVRADGGAGAAAQDACPDFEAGFGRFGRDGADLDPFDPGKRRRLLIEGVQEARAIAALDFHQDAVAVVEYPARQLEASGEDYG